MAIFSASELQFASAVSRLAYTNPFSRARIELEIEALGAAADRSQRVWSLQDADDERDRPNVVNLVERAAPMVEAARTALLAGGAGATPRELRLYEDLCLYVLYEQHRVALAEATEAAVDRPGEPIAMPTWRVFKPAFDRLLRLPGVTLPRQHDPAHVFACYFQIRRAFANIFNFIVGSSAPAAALREAVWQSIFTCDLRRYFESLHRCMSDFTTLITGPSGTGKELVARAIGQSRYIPFDARRAVFPEGFAGAFLPVSLAALSPTLIESELFGHQRGSFTGATADHAGYFEACPAQGTVFLDEIGELAGGIQVKLLRVLQDRTFQRLGDATLRRFAGKVIAATHRDLAAMIDAGDFREDLYYRLCSDTVTTPTLRAQLDDSPQDRAAMVGYIVRRAMGHADDAIAANVDRAIGQQVGDAYPWPGNFRELEQCVRNILIRGRYTPRPMTGVGQLAALDRELTTCPLSAEELTARYCARLYARLGSYVAVADHVALDRRTVKKHVDADKNG